MIAVTITAIIGGTIWGIINLIVQHRLRLEEVALFKIQKELDYKNSCLETYKDKVSLLSEDCSKHIIKLIEDYQSDTAKGMHDFLKDATDLLTKLEQKTQTTASINT